MYFRNQKNQKVKFKASAIAQSISYAFNLCYGKDTSKLRQEIQQMAQQIVKQFEILANNNTEKEWYYDEVEMEVEQTLANHGFEQVVEKLQEIKNHGEKQSHHRPVHHQLEIGRANPEWAILDSRTGAKSQWRKEDWLKWWKQLSYTVRGRETNTTLVQVLKNDNDPLLKTTEEWLTWWKDKLLQAISSEPEMIYVLGKIEIDGETAWLAQTNWVTMNNPDKGDGQKNDEKAGDEKAGDKKAGDKKAWEQQYRQQWIKHIQQTCPQLSNKYNVDKLSEMLNPAHDYLLSWQGYRKLYNSGALWEVLTPTAMGAISPPETSQPRREPPQEKGQLRREPPQWMWLRVAMEIAQIEAEPNKWAQRWYKSFSQLEVIPTTVLMRQAGKIAPRLIEDIAGRVIDNFESTQEAIYQAAINTKWTGTVSLDWSKVRAKGASVNGQRISQGVNAFIKAIDSNLLTQGRQGQEKPVTVSLPIWHLEIEEFIDNCAQNVHVQPVITIPDNFMRRVYDKQSWTLLDPGYLEGVELSNEQTYEKVEQDITGKKFHQTHQPYRLMKAATLWHKLMQKMATTGTPFILFTGPGKAYEPFPDSSPSQHGIDGVGGLPLQLPLLKAPGKSEEKGGREIREGEEEVTQTAEQQNNYRPVMPWVMWPAGAVNLAKVVGPDGQVNLKRMQRQITLAIRMLDNVFTLSEQNKKMLSWAMANRAVCLGAVGFRDAIEKAVKIAGDDPEARQQWIAGLAESWSIAVLKAEQELKNERGAANAWRGIEKGKTDQKSGGRVFNPQAFVARLKNGRHGQLTMPWSSKVNWQAVEDRIKQSGGHRLSGRTLWAPFEEAAMIANASPGGISNPAWREEIIDETGAKRQVPSATYLNLPQNTDHKTHKQVTTKGTGQKLNCPQLSLTQWKERIQWAGLIRPWVDQGVSVTLDNDLNPQDLQVVVEQAWLAGVDVIRFQTKQNYQP